MPFFNYDTQMPVRLTFPKRIHTLDDLRPLYEEFKRLHPGVVDQWRAIEAKERLDDADELKSVSSVIQDFLSERADWDSRAALITGFVDFRALINEEIRQTGKEAG